MTTETFALKARQGLSDCFLTESELVLDDDMNDGVEPEIWQFDVLSAMVSRNHRDPIAFVGLEPDPGNRRNIGIV